jgi:hypothetical protein
MKKVTNIAVAKTRRPAVMTNFENFMVFIVQMKKRQNRTSIRAIHLNWLFL